MVKLKTVCLFFVLTFSSLVYAQEDLFSEIDTDSVQNEYVSSVFKGLKVINFESTKMASKGEFYFVVSHRFGSVKGGFKELFGLDQAATRLNFIYGISDGFNIGISRSAFQKTYEMSLKYRLLQQGVKGGSPVTIVGFNSVSVNTLMDEALLPKIEFADRLAYVSQILISRKINRSFSLELIPTLLHENYVENNMQDNTQYVIGFGGRHKITKRLSFNFDWGYHLNREKTFVYRNPLAVGVDIETGGHVFQLHFSNAQPSFESGYLSKASGDWGKGDFFFGFNLSRVF